MSRLTRQIILVGTAALTAAMSIVLLAHPDIVRDPHPPQDVVGMAAWLNRHPADWITASLLTDRSLDSSLPRRLEIWRASHALTTRLSPLRKNGPAAFVRAGLFHWYELSSQDRKAVLATAAPLLRERAMFESLYLPLYNLTGDFAYLLRSAPPEIDAVMELGKLAVTRGRFANYRATRETVRRLRWRTFQAERSSASTEELMALLPDHISTGDMPLVKGILMELDRRPVDFRHGSPRTEDLTLFALRHRLEPLGGLLAIAETKNQLDDATRARVALAAGRADLASQIELTTLSEGGGSWVAYDLERARYEAGRENHTTADTYLGRAGASGLTAAVLDAAADVAEIFDDQSTEEDYRRQLADLAAKPPVWRGTCGENEICESAMTLRYFLPPARKIPIDISVVQTDQIPPYIEIYVDDTMVAEGEVADEQRFEVPIAPGLRRIEVRLVNPYTKNRIQRRVRLS